MKTTRFVTAVLGVCLSVATMGGEVKASDFEWVSGAHLIHSPIIQGVTEAQFACTGPAVTVDISGLEDRDTLCTTVKTADAEVGTYAMNQKSAVRFGSSVEALPLFNCSPVDCLYDPATDLIVTKQHVLNNWTTSLVIYKHASQRMQMAGGLNNAKGYSFDLSHPDFIDWDANGYPVLIGAMALSQNGRWLAVELPDYGVGVMNLQDFSFRKVSEAVAPYGYGMNPTMNLAISNDGVNIATAGLYTTDAIIERTPDCDTDVLNTPLSEPTSCQFLTLDQYLTDIQNGLLQAYRPSFSDDGNQLVIAGQYWPNTVRYATLRVFGAPESSIDYLGLGDSYTSGEGEIDDAHYLLGTNDSSEKCHTSDRSYPFLVATLDGGGAVHNVACSGATIADIVSSTDVYTGQSHRLGSLDEAQRASRQTSALQTFQPGEIPQESFVNYYHPRVILVGIGGNDAGFMDKVKACMMPDECEWVSNDGKAKTKQEIINLSSKLVALYQKIQRDSPESIIYTIGYPQIIKSDGACDLLTALLFNENERHYMVDTLHFMNQTIASAARIAGVHYLNVENAYGDHRLCGGSMQLAVNELQLGDDVAPITALSTLKLFGNEAFHPTPLGHQLVAQAIHQQVASLKEVSLSCEECDVDPQPPTDWPNQSSSQSVATTLTTPQLAITSPAFTISLYGKKLQPGSTTRIELHSNRIVLTTIPAADDGSFTANLTLPKDTPPGYHTLHVYGTSYSGDPVDYYQTIFIQDMSVKDDVPSLLPVKPSIVSDRTNVSTPFTASAPGTLIAAATMPSVKGVSTARPAMAHTVQVAHTWWKFLLVSAFIGCAITVVILLLRSFDE